MKVGFPLLLGLLLILSATAFGQGGGGERTNATPKEPGKKESAKSPPKNSSARPAATTPGFRFDGAYQFILPEAKGVLWIRFLRAGDVLFINTRNSGVETPRNCLIENPSIDKGMGPFLKPACEKARGSGGGDWGRSNAPPRFLDSDSFEFVFISSGTFTGRLRGNTLFLKHDGSDLSLPLFPSSAFKFYKMTFNDD